MKYLFAAVLLFFCGNVLAQDTIYYDNSRTMVPDKSLAYSYEVKSFLKDNNDFVLVREYYTSRRYGKKSEKIYASWKENMLQGKEMQWDTAGKVILEHEHDSRKLNGEFLTYGNSGKIRAEVFKDGELKSDASMDGQDTLYFKCEKMPEFPKGEQKLFWFLQSNLKYPPYARENGMQGRVYISFIVGKDGTITNIDVIRGVEKSLDEEALRVVQLMPPWSLGMQDGNPVRVRFNLPINFALK